MVCVLFTPGFTCPVLLWVPLELIGFLATGFSPSMTRHSNASPNLFSLTLRPVPQEDKSSWFGLFPFRSPLLRESHSLSFPPLTEMFHFSGFAFSPLCIQDGIVIADRVSPFGNPRICLFAAPRGLSQLIASFFARCLQGIHTVACNFLLLVFKSFAVSQSHSRHNVITIVVIPLCANCQRTEIRLDILIIFCAAKNGGRRWT